MLKITTAKTTLAPRILLYGPAGIGKTTLGSMFPGAVILPVEDGADGLECPKLPRPVNWEAVIATLQELVIDHQGIKTLVVDSITEVERMVQRFTAEKLGIKAISDIPYQKGFDNVVVEMVSLVNLLTALRAKGVAIILIGHMSVIKYEDPRTAGYDRFQPALHKSCGPLITQWCDAVLCANYRVYTEDRTGGFNKTTTKAKGEGERVIYCDEKPTHIAKNRYWLPSEVSFSWGEILTGIGKAFAPSAVAGVAATQPINQSQPAEITADNSATAQKEG
jgi:hypothetical protein